MNAPAIKNGLLAIVKRDCPTCVLVVPVLEQLAGLGNLTVYSQDDPGFPEAISEVTHDGDLSLSYNLDVEFVPTLIRFENGVETARTFGWDVGLWRELSGMMELGAGLPEQRPGCAALNQDPDRLAALKLRHGDAGITARPITIGALEDPIEACFEQDWSDGLPVVPPTPERVFAMLQGTERAPEEVIGLAPPNIVPCSVEKIAINAVMAGCKPEYMPVVLTAVACVLDEVFGLHGVLPTTRFVGPVILVNGPIARRIGMNAKGNVLGQGNRANATIGRAVQLVIRNVGGGKPGGVDRATLGNPGKLTYCFAEDEEDAPWLPYCTDAGFAAGTSTVTAFAGYGLQGIVDERARTAEELLATFASSLRAVDNINKFPSPDAMLVVCPEHQKTFIGSGWDKARLQKELLARLTVPADSVQPGANGIAEGASKKLRGQTVAKFSPGGLLIVCAGGGAGKFSGIIAGFSAGSKYSSRPVTKEVTQ